MRLAGGEMTGVDEVIGKTLYGLTDVPYKQFASDSARVAGVFAAGSPVGVVYSYLMPGPGRSHLWWVFVDQMGNNYYAEHLEGRYSFEALRSQGVKTTEERIQEQVEANKDWTDKAIDAGKQIALIAILVFAGVQLAPVLFGARR